MPERHARPLHPTREAAVWRRRRVLRRRCRAFVLAAGQDRTEHSTFTFPVARPGSISSRGYIYSTRERVIFDPLYKYDHLARPLKLVPNTAVALPEITADGRSWTIRVKPGIFFADDPAFKGKKRELTAHDYVYSWKRILDPRTRSNNLQVFDGRFVGSEAAMRRRRNPEVRLDTRSKPPGDDRYTIRMKAQLPGHELLSNLTSRARGGAREVIDAYGDAATWTMANRWARDRTTQEWRRGQKIVLRPTPIS